jgi:hypothetical protein
MSEHQPGGPEDPGIQGPEQSDAGDAPVGGLSPAPTTPTSDKEEPEAGTGSADKRSPESQAEQDQPPGGAEPGTAGGDITR